MTKRWLVLFFCMVWAGGAFGQEEQNGLQITVSRKTTARDDQRTAYYLQKMDRTMALHVVVKNVSMKPLPEGRVEYSLLVNKALYYEHKRELYTGSEVLPALQPAATADVVLGSAQVNGYRDLFEQRKDKMDYKVVLVYNGKPMATVTSKEGFDSAAMNATKMASKN